MHWPVRISCWMHCTVVANGWMHHTGASTCVTSVSSQAATLCHPSHWKAAAATEIWLPPHSSLQILNPTRFLLIKSHQLRLRQASPSVAGCWVPAPPWETPEPLSPPIWGVHQTKWGHITPFRGCTASTQSQPIWGQHKCEMRL